MKRFIKNLVIALSSLSLAATAWAGPKTLIKYEGGSISPGLAASAQKLGANQYKFELSAEQVGGQPLTPALVKSSLESEAKLKSFGIAVEAAGASSVVVSFTGDEGAFLSELGKTRIRAGGGGSLALESSVSDGGIRAKTAERGPTPTEVKGQVVSVSGDSIKLVVTEAGSQGPAAQAKVGQAITVSGRGSFAAKKGAQIFFTPQTANPWKAAQFTEK